MIYNKKNLEVSKVANKKDTRLTLSSVYFTPKATVATDAFRLIEVSVPKVNISHYPNDVDVVKDFEPFMVSAGALSKVKAPAPNKEFPVLDNVVVTSVTDENVGLTTTDLEVVDTKTLKKVVGEEYPKYEQIKPTGDPVAKIKISAKYLKEMANLLEGYDKQDTVDIEFFGNEKPIVMKASNDIQSAYGLIMPIRQ